MENTEKSLLYKAYNPYLQASGIFLIGLVINIFSKLIQLTGLIEVGPYFCWLTAAAFLLFFALFNSISSLSAKDINRYWGKSIISFALLAITSGGAAWLLSSISIYDAGSYAWIFVTLTFSYLVFLSIIGFMKSIVEFAQKEEWSQPALRVKNRKRRKKQ